MNSPKNIQHIFSLIQASTQSCMLVCTTFEKGVGGGEPPEAKDFLKPNQMEAFPLR